MKKPLGLFGALLVLVGLVALAYQGFTYTQREKVLDIGPIHATADRERTVALPPIVGIVAVVAGLALIVVGQRPRG
jgi:dipeptide/tripeptide permease